MAIATGTQKISAINARKQFGDMLNKTYYRQESFIIERAGEPKAAIVPIREYIDMQRRKKEARARFFAKAKTLRQAFKDVDPDEIEREIDKAVREVRRRRQSK